MHIILTILKIAGWILLILILLALALLAAVVFVPVRYKLKAQVSTTQRKWSGDGTASWLLHLVRFSCRVENDRREFGLYVLGVPVGRRRKRGSQKRREKEEQASGPSISNLPISNPPISNPPAHDGGLLEEDQTMELYQAAENRKTPSFFRRVKDFFVNLKGVCLRTLAAIRNVYERTGSVKKTIVWYLQFWNDQTTVAAREMVVRELRRLLRHYRPRRWNGQLTVGLSDPADTGFLLAALAVLYPAFGDGLTVRPDYERTVFEGDFALRGRIRAFWLVKAAVKLFFAEEIRETYNKWTNSRKDG